VATLTMPWPATPAEPPGAPVDARVSPQVTHGA
jgi:hypothetical protein